MELAYSWGTESEAPADESDVEVGSTNGILFTLPRVTWMQSVEPWETLAGVWRLESSPQTQGRWWRQVPLPGNLLEPAMSHCEVCVIYIEGDLGWRRLWTTLPS